MSTSCTRPPLAVAEGLSRNDYASLKQAQADAREILASWDKIAVTGLSTSVDKYEVVTEGQRMDVTCVVDQNGVRPGLLDVELFYLLQEQNEHRIVPMRPRDAGRASGVFECSFEIEGRGLLSMNARVRPASPILQDLYPDLVKWAQ